MNGGTKILSTLYVSILSIKVYFSQENFITESNRIVPMTYCSDIRTALQQPTEMFLPRNQIQPYKQRESKRLTKVK